MADHRELMEELEKVEGMATVDRLKHARKRRMVQLKKYAQYDKQIDKDLKKKKTQKNKDDKKQKKNLTTKKSGRNIKFVNNVMLLEAAGRNDLDEVKQLLNQHVSPDVANEDGLTALHQCCIDDYEAMLRLLIHFGANVNAMDSEQWTPLHAAATCGHVELCKLLIRNGAELLAVNADGNMPYDICEDGETLDYIETEMSSKGVTQEMIDETRLAPEKALLADMKTLYRKQGNFDFRDIHSATPLHIAAANGYIEVVDYLLSNNCEVHLMDKDQWQPIHAAACWGHLSILEKLVYHGADLDAKTKTGETPLQICEDPDIQRRIVELKLEVETNETKPTVEQRHRRSINTRSSFTNSTSSIYNSNSSLTGGPNPFSTRRESLTGSNKSLGKDSASVRRTSMREKSALSRKEARDEAKIRDSMTAENGEIATNGQNVPSSNIDDVNLDVREDNQSPYGYAASSEAIVHPRTKITDGDIITPTIEPTPPPREPTPPPREPTPPPREPTPPPREPTPPPREPTPPPREPTPPPRESTPPPREVPKLQIKPVVPMQSKDDRQVAPVKPQPQSKKHSNLNNNDGHGKPQLHKNPGGVNTNHTKTKNTTNKNTSGCDVAVVAPQPKNKPSTNHGSNDDLNQLKKPSHNTVNSNQQYPPMYNQSHLSWNPSGQHNYTLSELKKQRRNQGQPRGSIDNGIVPRRPNNVTNEQGNNGSTVTYVPQNDSENKMHFKAHMETEIIGSNSEKEGCCVIL